MQDAPAAATRRSRRDTALWYAVDRRWYVLPGIGGGRAAVPPQRDAATPAGAATRDPARVTEWWDHWPDARVLLPAGRDFDVIDVPARPGADALARLLRLDQPALAPGPVAAAQDGRYHFYVAPGACEDLAELLEWLDWGGIDLGVRGIGAGDLVPAPALPGDAGAVGELPRWVHGERTRPPELVALLGIIADACHRWRISQGR